MAKSKRITENTAKIKQRLESLKKEFYSEQERVWAHINLLKDAHEFAAKRASIVAQTLYYVFAGGVCGTFVYVIKNFYTLTQYIYQIPIHTFSPNMRLLLGLGVFGTPLWIYLFWGVIFIIGQNINMRLYHKWKKSYYNDRVHTLPVLEPYRIDQLIEKVKNLEKDL